MLITILYCFLQLSLPMNYHCQRPQKENRLFVSEQIEQKIEETAKLLKNDKLRWMFINCFPNTLDTTIHFDEDKDGEPRTFVYTGDIPAMWLRDSGAQVWSYIDFVETSPSIKKMIKGVIKCQFSLINIDPYANAFNDGPTGVKGDNADDTGQTQKPEVFERKWEIDSHCYPVRLAYHYWKKTKDISIFDDKWLLVVKNILNTFKEQQKKHGEGSYYFLRVTDRQLDTKVRVGWGNPLNPVGLIASSFRPSDDATTFEFLVPSNFFAVDILNKAAEILVKVNKDEELAKECKELAEEVLVALQKYAVVENSKYGKIYAYEVDGFGNHYLMDDANVPSLLSLSYLIPEMKEDPIYKNTRNFVLSKDNPYFWKGKAGEGIGSPHIGTHEIWPMSIIMRAFTSVEPKEIKDCIEMLINTDAGTGFIHESFNKDDASKFTRPWFAWQNSLFGELILYLIENGHLDLLNSIPNK